MTALTVAVPVVLLQPGSPAPAAELGGKAASLDRLVQVGFPVPATAVVTASTYRSIAAHPDLAPLLTVLRDGAEVEGPEVDAAFLAVPVPRPLEQAIVAAAREVGGGQRIAVRSSATVEDMAGASFAGQYRSSLDVDPDDVLHAVRLTWASLWHPAPCAYRRAWGVPSDDVAMPAALMRMVDARSAGVAFTVDPEGDAGRVRVEAVPELAEALVSGARTPDVWLLPRDHGAEPSVPRHIREAADLALAVERSAGGAPQDVEWAWDGDRTWLVQARPITTGPARLDDGSDTPRDAAGLTTAGIGETLPGVLPPLVWDVASFLVEEALRGVLGRLWDCRRSGTARTNSCGGSAVAPPSTSICSSPPRARSPADRRRSSSGSTSVPPCPGPTRAPTHRGGAPRAPSCVRPPLDGVRPPRPTSCSRPPIGCWPTSRSSRGCRAGSCWPTGSG
jgi:pyruvate,water dikinase